MKHLTRGVEERIRSRLQRLYGEAADRCWRRLSERIEDYAPRLAGRQGRLWDHRDVILITYADQVQSPQQSPLRALQSFLADYSLERQINTIHLLPFFPYSSDDGFSVIDYREVDARVGDWDDIRALGQHWSLMFDLVLNHVSQQSPWFQNYLIGRPPFDQFFIESDLRADLSAVTRPRSSPLLTPFETSRGQRHLWTTFSSDQIDLNYSNPDVLVEMTDLLLFYVQQGARILRLDAVAYLWKERGTGCIHLHQTHEVVKLWRDILDAVAPGVLLLTETNVPHRENISYFGQGDEAHMVYQFSLPPLLLDALLNEDAGPLQQWLAELEPPPAGATYFNFTASHDGIGVRPLEGLVSPQRFQQLIRAIEARGGGISTRRTADGRDMPYELNITYRDALGEPGGRDAGRHARRFLASQAIMLALQGIPGVYFHSLVGTENDQAAVEATGQRRRINRRKFTRDQLDQRLADGQLTEARIFAGYQRLLQARIAQPAFHPDAKQQVARSGPPELLALQRTSLDGSQRIVMLANLGAAPRTVQPREFFAVAPDRDLLSDQQVRDKREIELDAYQVMWITCR